MYKTFLHREDANTRLTIPSCIIHCKKTLVILTGSNFIHLQTTSNAEPADDASAREVINNLFSLKRYDLGDVGRYRINKNLTYLFQRKLKF